ncbi:hypothetical protein SANTM175S_02665 [Streptomyces antimycoticus]
MVGYAEALVRHLLCGGRSVPVDDQVAGIGAMVVAASMGGARLHGAGVTPASNQVRR